MPLEIQIHFQCQLIIIINNLRDPQTPRHEGYNSTQRAATKERPGEQRNRASPPTALWCSDIAEPVPNSRKGGDQPRSDHRGADPSIAGLIPNPSLQSALSGLIGAPLHRPREIKSGSPQSLPHQRSGGLALVLVVITALLCLFRDNKESGCGEEERRGEADRTKGWTTISFGLVAKP